MRKIKYQGIKDIKKLQKEKIPPKKIKLSNANPKFKKNTENKQDIKNGENKGNKEIKKNKEIDDEKTSNCEDKLI